MALPLDPSNFLQPGSWLIERYELIKELGRGGMGIVWLVRDHVLKIDVACKFLPDLLRQDRAALDELRDEARRSLRLTNERIVRIYDFIDAERIAGITMELVDGETLAARKAAQPHRHFEAGMIESTVRQLCEALHYAHTGPRIVHRDLKPANLMVARDGTLKITDFGIARSISDTFSRVSNAAPVSGTLVYMSPQQLLGEAPKPTDDIYSVGATIYDLLTGKPPFHTGSIQTQVLHVPPPPMNERRRDFEVPGEPIPAVWEEVVAACLAKDPTTRPATALEIIRRLEGSPCEVRPTETYPATFSLPPEKGFAPAASPVAPPVGVPAVWPKAEAPSPRGGQGLLISAIFALLTIVGIAAGFFAWQAGMFGAAEPSSAPAPTLAPKAQPETGRLMVNTIPSGARVYIDGREAGISPVTIPGLAPGDHRIRMEHTDYEPLEVAALVQPGGTADPGTLHLVARPRATPPPVVVPPQPTHPFSPPAEPKAAPVPPAPVGLTDETVNAVIIRQLTATKARDLNTLMSCYTNPVDYFDEGNLTAPRLRESIRTYFGDWPYFDIEILGSRIEETADPDEKIARFDYRFVAKAGKKISTGIAHDTVYVRRYLDGVFIRKLRQVITERQKNFK